MRLQILSDLHADINRGLEVALAPKVDAIVVAGDVCEGTEQAFAWLRRRFPADTPIVFVIGNHELYHSVRNDERRIAAAAARAHGILLLDNSEARMGHCRFIGATLWTSYSLFGAASRHAAMDAAEQDLMDHRLIMEVARPARRFRAADAHLEHVESRKFIGRTLAEPWDGPTVVVTHHAPHPLSVAARYREDRLTPAFVSDLSALIEKHQPTLWVHGHTHVGFDYSVGKTRVVCNPHGYGRENPAFDPWLVIDV